MCSKLNNVEVNIFNICVCVNVSEVSIQCENFDVLTEVCEFNCIFAVYIK